MLFCLCSVLLVFVVISFYYLDLSHLFIFGKLETPLKRIVELVVGDDSGDYSEWTGCCPEEKLSLWSTLNISKSLFITVVIISISFSMLSTSP